MVTTEGIPGAKVWMREGEIVSHELTAFAHADVTRLMEESRRARTVEQHVELQQKLAKLGWEARGLKLEIEARKKELRLELRERKAAGDMERVRSIGAMLRDHELTLAANRRRWFAVRAVQDGIIWRLFGFNRSPIAALGLGEPVTWLSESFPNECAVAEEHWAEGRLAVFCDLSNCINSGDLLVFDTRKGQIVVVEVKESEEASEQTEQMRKIEVKLEYLNTGRSEELADAPLVLPRTLPPLKTHLSVLRDLLTQAGREGMAMSKAGDVAAV